MALLICLDIFCKTTLTSRNNNNKTLIFTKAPITFALPCFSTNSSASFHFSKSKSQYLTSSPSQAKPHKTSSFKGEKTLLFENFHQNQSLRTSLLRKLKEKDSDPLLILKDDGDWSKEHFWFVIKFLKQTSRFKEALQVFDLWKNKENSRINEFNYEKIIGLLAAEELIEEAVLALGEMKSHGLRPSLEIYNSVIHGFTRKGRFEDALFYLKEMEEIELKPDTETYDGFIQAYGNCGMYDEMGQCVKKMESNGCLPDHITYNLLIREFSQAGLLERMERTYQILISKRMDLQSSSLVAMLEAYANFRILDKMEKVYRRILNSKIPLKEDLIRKLAGVYIENYMFSRLDDLGLDLSSKTIRNDHAWCLRILYRACLLSRKGINYIIQEMESKRMPWNVTVANIILLTYLKMKDFKHLNFVLSELPPRYVKPDIVTVGILFDASRLGFDGTWTLNTWRRMGFLDEAVEMNTDALVLTAFGKGHFLRSCEECYSSLEPNSRKNKAWTYRHLIDLVSKHNKRLLNQWR